MARTYLEEARRIEVTHEVDVLVLGGGPSGVGAAVGAARAGARVLIVESNGYMGGMWTAGLVTEMVGFNKVLRPYTRIVDGVAGEWVARAAAINGAVDDSGFALSSNPEVMKRIADDLLEEAGVAILYHTWAARPIVEDGAVIGAFLENVEGRSAVLAKVTVDCTGNGDAIARSGAEWVKGQTLQPMTMCFYMAHARPDESVPHNGNRWMDIGPEPGYMSQASASRRTDIVFDRDDMLRRREAGELPLFGGPWLGGMHKDIVWVNTTRVLGDASLVGELTRAEIRGRREAARMMEYFRAHVPELAEAEIIQTSPQIGVRETRRLVGTYTLTGAEIREGCRFDDSIGLAAWPIDMHTAEAGTRQEWVPDVYEIPYRSLVPKTMDGLLAAGRCISVDREALASVRVGGTCAVTGHAAGVAAALAVEGGVQPREIDVRALQGALTEQRALISVDSL